MSVKVESVNDESDPQSKQVRISLTRKRIKFKGRLAGFVALFSLAICHLFIPKFVEEFLNDERKYDV
ncbi:TPA: hypothetical protein AB5C39_000701 [Vibrio mimicus]|uniref:Uncharacterized protein n=1 Tax=Vibrio vulnificus TaxID=672 RepID=A0AAI8ZLI0_VIBVL|nr:hypothetical protein [Vibrio vulnificus]OQK43792.1 putative membrane protein [Vibrio vulnificus]CDM12447.1 hypothetical protein [Vibrio vulnificus]